MTVPIIVTSPPPPPPGDGDSDDRQPAPELTVTVNYNPVGGLTPQQEARARRMITITANAYERMLAKLLERFE